MALPSRFKFKKFDTVGSAAAEEDESYLQSCFVDTGVLRELRDLSTPKRILLARTGVGKSALIIKLRESEERVITIKPESLALTHISNSTIMTHLNTLGVKLDVFFRFLWKHVFAVEVFKAHFKVGDEPAKLSFFQQIQSLFGVRKYKLALDYINKWGGSFWEDTEYRIKEIIKTFETDLKEGIDVKVSGSGFHTSSGKALSQEEKQEVIHKAQNVVNNVQIRHLSEILELLDELLDDRKKRYFIVIDKLDESWVEDRLRYRLIRALLDCVRDFRKVSNLKIVVALRLDLMQQVFRLTRDAGFQEEKYESLYLPIEWNEAQLKEVLEKRINHMVEMRFTNQTVSCTDIFPKSKGSSWVDYMIERTMMRPRDVIIFFNECIKLATEKQRLTADIIREAERAYSRGRLRSLGDEWIEQFPSLIDFLLLLKGKPATVELISIKKEEIEDFCLERTASITTDTEKDVLLEWAGQVVDEHISAEDFKKKVAVVFHRVGAVGIKATPEDPVSWNRLGSSPLSAEELGPRTKISIHPALHMALAVRGRD